MPNVLLRQGNRALLLLNQNLQFIWTRIRPSRFTQEQHKNDYVQMKNSIVVKSPLLLFLVHSELISANSVRQTYPKSKPHPLVVVFELEAEPLFVCVKQPQSAVSVSSLLLWACPLQSYSVADAGGAEATRFWIRFPSNIASIPNLSLSSVLYDRL